MRPDTVVRIFVLIITSIVRHWFLSSDPLASTVKSQDPLTKEHQEQTLECLRRLPRESIRRLQSCVSNRNLFSLYGWNYLPNILDSDDADLCEEYRETQKCRYFVQQTGCIPPVIAGNMDLVVRTEEKIAYFICNNLGSVKLASSHLTKDECTNSTRHQSCQKMYLPLLPKYPSQGDFTEEACNAYKAFKACILISMKQCPIRTQDVLRNLFNVSIEAVCNQ